MLISVFSEVLRMSLTSSFVILFVCLVRLLLKHLPKIYSYILWTFVLFRLLCPVSLETHYSFIPEPLSSGELLDEWSDDYVGEVHFIHEGNLKYDVAVDHGRQPIVTGEGQSYVVTGADGISEPRTVHNSVLPILSVIWVCGILLLSVYSTVSYLRLCRMIKVSVKLTDRIFLGDDISFPFVIGLFYPRIYLPATLHISERKYIIAHEMHHIRRGDPVIKALAYIALMIHWFNPLVWLAFTLANRDMEMSCDEAVIRKLGDSVRGDYSASLLNMATGKKIFSITPLAFGEVDPTHRVRNLAKWRKPAVWVAVVCVILCCFLATCLMSDPAVDEIIEIDVVETTQNTEPSQQDWGITIIPERISRTGATAVFYFDKSIPEEDRENFDYGDYLTLEVLKNDTWTPVPELPGYEYYVGDSSYPVMDGYGMVHEWRNRFGELPDGQYRLGKSVTGNKTGGGREERMIFGEFTLSNEILSQRITLEMLPEKYGAETAMIDGCFVQQDGVARENKDLFQDFAVCSWNGMPSFIRIVDWYYGDNSHYVASDLEYDGEKYIITWLEDGRRVSKEYPYLKYFSGEKERDNMAYDAYEHYVLTYDESMTWETIYESLVSSQDSNITDYMIIYSDYIYYPVEVHFPDYLSQAVLELEGEPLVTVTDFDRLEKIYLLFTGAEVLGYEPKTHSVGLGLNLILTTRSGDVVTVELDPDNDICRINGEFVFYGAYDEPSYVEKLWYYLDIPAWPEIIYEKYPNAYRP